MKTRKHGNQTKVRISVTIAPMINDLLEKISESEKRSKSVIVEDAIKHYLQHKLEDQMKILAKIKFDDLPSEDEWLQIQSEI